MPAKESLISDSNKRIAKNTLFLYMRMVVLTLINLYTSRVILRELGVSDFGTYSVVGGVIVVFSFLSGPLASGCQRFINFELGKNDIYRVREVFSSSIFMLLAMSLLIVVLGETVGLWFLNNKMSFPEGRIFAANIVYQISIATFIVNLMAVPYNAVIVAHERMSVFAYISIVEALGKLLVAISIVFAPIDRLIFYSTLLFILGIIIRLIYQWYCVRNFEESVFAKRFVSKDTVKSMVGFSSWVVLGGIRQVCHTQGISIIVNIFFGVTVNAAQGIANQVNHAVSVFVNNFLTAMNPQIVKLYATGEYGKLKNLVYRGTRFSIFLVSLFSIPIIIEAPQILSIWLGSYPPYTVIFVRAIIATTLIESFATIIKTTMGATGEIKNYQVSLVLIGILHIPIAWIAFSLGCEPYWSMYIYMIIAIILQIVRIAFVSKILLIKSVTFYKQVIVRCLVYLVFASLIPYIVHTTLPESLLSSITVILLSLIISPIFFYVIGCDNIERKKIECFIKGKIHSNDRH